MVPFVSPSIDVLLISGLLVVVSKFMQSRFMDKKQMAEDREKMKKQQERMKDLMNKEDKKSKQEIEQINKDMMETMSKSMQSSMKYMMISLPVFLVAFWLLGIFYAPFEPYSLPVPLPWFGEGLISLAFYSETSWFGWYFVSYLSFTIVIGIAGKIVSRLKGE